jgi:hypothetical protein
LSAARTPRATPPSKIHEKWTKAAETCTDALKLDATNGKALFRRATANEQLCEVDKGLADGKAATPADDAAAAIQALFKRAEAKIARRTEEREGQVHVFLKFELLAAVVCVLKLLLCVVCARVRVFLQ